MELYLDTANVADVERLDDDLPVAVPDDLKHAALALERLLESLSFDAPDKGGNVHIDRAYVDAQLGELAQDPDLSRYIL